MSSNSSRVVGVCHAGVGWTKTEWQTIRAVFHDFPSLPSDRISSLELSPTVVCHGLEWQLWVYPGGDENSSETSQHATIYLYSKDAAERDVKITANFTIRIPANGFSVEADRKCFQKQSSSGGLFSMWGLANFARRDDILDPSMNFLVNDNLIIEASIQIMLESPPAWAPRNTLGTDMLKMLESADAATADVLFEVGKKRGKKGKVYAHRNVLAFRAPALAALLEDCNNDNPFPIQDIEEKIFRQLLRFVYGGEVPYDVQVPDDAQMLITVADRFGVTGLKLATESELASRGISIDNAAELILFADAKNCADLKEAAVNFFVANTEAVMATKGFAKVQESAEIARELMRALSLAARGKKRPAPSGNGDNNYSSMRVRVLRWKLDEKGLEVDGSREVLIARLEEAEANSD